ncbi:promethin [Echeneis naucrates]|uniref:Transmembrane protein 159 n=1 Tax=Echeneis naucrates TaxID=173247 RepID=A0A665V2C8_ECHNA|nr:promethin [Echeneis naucrates]
MQNNSHAAELQQQLQGRWSTLLNRLHNDPKVKQMMETKFGQYLSGHPVVALTVLVFGAMAALPVGLFLMFALVTIIMSAVGFVFFEVSLLFVGGLTLLCVLSGLGFFSVMVSLIFSVFYTTIFNIHSYYDPRMTKKHKVLGKESESETSTSTPTKQEEVQ